MSTKTTDAFPRSDRQPHQELPRLLYLGDVPVEASYHGSTLLYRLLQNYPRERLLIVEGNFRMSSAGRRLPGVRYTAFPTANARLLFTRFATWYSSWLIIAAARRINRLDKLYDGFRPTAVLTVTHGHSWMKAAWFASRYGLPLHLICHDDWPRFTDVVAIMKHRIDVTFGSMYRQAASRLCISPFMREAYRERYRADGVVLYPFRAADTPVYKEPPSRLGKRCNGLTVAFGGTINSRQYGRSLKAIACILEAIGGKLLVFGPLSTEDVRRSGLNLPNVEVRGLLKYDELIRRLREEADVLFLPMSFGAGDRPNMELAFPSKFADYTAVGLPVLIYGPSYCSAVRWARDNPGIGEVVDAENTEWLSQAIHRLATNPAHRAALGARALEVGREYFTWETGQSVFHKALREHCSPVG